LGAAFAAVLVVALAAVRGAGFAAAVRGFALAVERSLAVAFVAIAFFGAALAAAARFGAALVAAVFFGAALVVALRFGAALVAAVFLGAAFDAAARFGAALVAAAFFGAGFAAVFARAGAFAMPVPAVLRRGFGLASCALGVRAMAASSR
jgi:hypothetical protein